MQGCVTELSVPRKPCPPSSMPSPPLNALKPSLGHSSSASPAAHKAPGGQIWAHFRHWTGWIKPGFGPKFISRNFIEISTNSSDSMLPWKKEGAFFFQLQHLAWETFESSPAMPKKSCDLMVERWWQMVVADKIVMPCKCPPYP